MIVSERKRVSRNVEAIEATGDDEPPENKKKAEKRKLKNKKSSSSGSEEEQDLDHRKELAQNQRRGKKRSQQRYKNKKPSTAPIPKKPHKPSVTDFTDDKRTIRKIVSKSDFECFIHEDADQLVEHFMHSFEDVTSELLKPNVLVVGCTGSGKSSLINSVFGKKLAQTGAGIPITQHYTRYYSDDLSVVIYDSRGLEHGHDSDFFKETKDFFRAHQVEEDGDSTNAIHVIWYIVNSAISRFQPFEEKICKELLNTAPLMFLLNKSDLSTQEDRNRLRNCIEAMELPNCIGVYDVISAPMKIRHFDRCPKCHSEDIVIRKKDAIGSCEECGYSEHLGSGFNNVISDTLNVLPIIVRDAFISAQNISFTMKDQAAKAVITEYYNDYHKIRTPSNFFKLVARMMARLSVLWDFKQHGELYGTEMAKGLVKKISWKDKLTMLFKTNMRAQQMYTTTLGILWNRCLRHLAAELFSELIGQNLPIEQIRKKCYHTISNIERQDLSEQAVTQIEKLIAGKGLEFVLLQETSYNISNMCHMGVNVQIKKSKAKEELSNKVTKIHCSNTEKLNRAAKSIPVRSSRLVHSSSFDSRAHKKNHQSLLLSDDGSETSSVNTITSRGCSSSDSV